MYHIIVLRQDGRMAMYDTRLDVVPSDRELEDDLKGFNYTQLLIVNADTGAVVRRYEYDSSPRLTRVGSYLLNDPESDV